MMTASPKLLPSVFPTSKLITPGGGDIRLRKAITSDGQFAEQSEVKRADQDADNPSNQQQYNNTKSILLQKHQVNILWFW